MSRAKLYLYCLGGANYAPAYPDSVPTPCNWQGAYLEARATWDNRHGRTPCAEDVAWAVYCGEPWDGRGCPDYILRRGKRGGVVRERC